MLKKLRNILNLPLSSHSTSAYPSTILKSFTTITPVGSQHQPHLSCSNSLPTGLPALALVLKTIAESSFYSSAQTFQWSEPSSLLHGQRPYSDLGGPAWFQPLTTSLASPSTVVSLMAQLSHRSLIALSRICQTSLRPLSLSKTVLSRIDKVGFLFPSGLCSNTHYQ